jgi:hypothetical protein
VHYLLGVRFPAVAFLLLVACGEPPGVALHGRWALQDGAGSIEFTRDRVTVRIDGVEPAVYAYRVESEGGGRLVMQWADGQGEAFAVEAVVSGDALELRALDRTWSYRRP